MQTLSKKSTSKPNSTEHLKHHTPGSSEIHSLGTSLVQYMQSIIIQHINRTKDITIGSSQYAQKGYLIRFIVFITKTTKKLTQKKCASYASN